MISIREINIYPVKGLSGISLDESGINRSGLTHDRHWMITRENGRFVTQRDLPALATIHTGLSDQGLVLSHPGSEAIRVDWDQSGEMLDSQVWKDPCRVQDQGKEVSDWLTTVLQSPHPLRLVRMAEGHQRPQNKPGRYGEDTVIEFADGAPLLVTNTQSLVQLNRELVSRGVNEVPMNRFRPNLVIDGLAAFAEHQSSGITNGELEIRFCYPCERCIVPTIDQKTAEVHPARQPFRTLVEINPMPDSSRAPAFGENAVLVSKPGQTIRVGDTFSLLSGSD